MSDGPDNVLDLKQASRRPRTVSLRRTPLKEIREHRAAEEAGAREDAALGLTAPPAKPATRAGCAPVCPSCQAWRDSIRDDGEPVERTCGHAADEAIARSRPCVFVSCRMNLFLDVIPPRKTHRGKPIIATSAPREASIKFNQPDFSAPEDVRSDGSCALDVADAGGATLETIGALMNLTRERGRQLEEVALTRLRNLPRARFLKNEMIDGPERYHLPVVREEPVTRADVNALRQALDRKKTKKGDSA